MLDSHSEYYPGKLNPYFDTNAQINYSKGKLYVYSKNYTWHIDLTEIVIWIEPVKISESSHNSVM